MARGGEFSSVNFFLRLGTRLSWVLSLLMGEGEEKDSALGLVPAPH